MRPRVVARVVPVLDPESDRGRQVAAELTDLFGRVYVRLAGDGGCVPPAGSKPPSYPPKQPERPAGPWTSPPPAGPKTNGVSA